MKNVLNYKYNLYPDRVINVKDSYYFFIDNNKYYIVKLNRQVEEIDLIFSVNKKLELMNKAVYSIVLDKENKKYFDFEEKNYMILKVLKEENKSLKLFDIIEFNKLLKTKSKNLLNRNDWKKLWSEKIDYYEYRMSVVKEENDIVNRSFSYYVGLAEDAVGYYVDTLLEEKNINMELCISHKRISYPTINAKIYNPLTFVFDYKVRDIAEYLKTMFFLDKLDWNEVLELFNKFLISKTNCRLFYARLLYPSYYFDAYEEYIETRDDKKLKNIISKSKEYEDFLFDIYYLIKKYAQIPEVEWIIRKKV